MGWRNRIIEDVLILAADGVDIRELNGPIERVRGRVGS